MEANYVHKDSTTLIQDKLVKNELNQIELQYNALKQQKFNELLKENKELKKQLEEANENIILLKASKPMLEYKKALEENQQKEFIKWLENGIEKVKNTEFLDERIQRSGLIAYNRCLQKYKGIIGDDK